MMVGLSLQRVLEGLDILQTQGRGEQRDLRLVRDYEPVNVSDKMLRIIQSYADFVQRRVWRREPG